MMKNNLKNKKIMKKSSEGITLIALVITIIVLLILAGISITMLAGENSILKQAGNSKEQTEETGIFENIGIAYNSGKIEKYTGTKTLAEKMEEELAKIYGADNVEVEDNGNENYTVTVNNKEYNIENGKVEKNGPVVNPYNPDEWESAWVYTAEGTWSEKITDKALIPQNYKIIAKLYEGKESGVKYSLVIEGEGEIKDLSVTSSNSDPDNFTPPECYAWQTGFFSSEGPLFFQEGNTVNVRICDGITGIGTGAFTFCFGLKSIKISNTVTSIGEYAFQYCKNLQNIKMSNSIISIGEYAFENCVNLQNIKMSNSIISIGKCAFQNCNNLQSIKIPNGVTNIGKGAFAGCNMLENVVISDSVTSIGDKAFESCDNLKNIEMSSSVTTIGDNAFYHCSSLTSIEIPNGVTTIGDNAFYYCSSLTSIEIPNSVTSIGNNAFIYCSGLTEIIIYKPEDSITGAKWDAPDSTEVRWIGSN